MAPEARALQLARADLCRYAAACYYEPGPEFSEERLFDSMVSAATAVDAQLAAGARRLRDAYVAEPIESLLVDYTRLFLGPTHILAKPYGSSWLTGEKTLMQDATMAVVALYSEGGFEMDDAFRELPDHIAAELEFLYLLIHRGCEAGRPRADHAVAAADGLRRRLIAEHLGRWVPRFAAAVQAEAETEFYRQVAALTGQLIAFEAAIS